MYKFLKFLVGFYIAILISIDMDPINMINYN